MIVMKKSSILILIICILVTIINLGYRNNNSTTNNTQERNLCYYENNSDYILIEKNILNNITSLLYKDNNDKFISVLYENDQEIKIDDLIKSDKLELYNAKIKELLYLKYPTFIADKLILDTVTKSYILRNNELVIYFNDYEIDPPIDELLYLRVNYNEIKDFLDLTISLDSTYNNESGYAYTNAKKAIAFTFDDSPNGSKTMQILDSLKNNKAHATFFVVGNKITPKGKDVLLSMKNLGNEIGSHTYDHANLYKKTDTEFINDYNLMNDLYKSIFNENLKLVRPPYGNIKESQKNLIPTSFILWSLDTNDWRYRNKNYLINYVLNNVQDGDIILFHDSYQSTVAAVNELLPLLYSKGYQIMSVSELFNLKGLNIENNKIYHNAR